MLQHKITAQILLILSIFNLVIAAPVVREVYETHDDEVVPVAARNVGVMSEERRSSELDGPTPSDSSVPLPDGPTPSHFSPPSPDESMPLFTSSTSDGAVSLKDWLIPPGAGGPASSSLVSSPPGETVPATDEAAPMHSTSPGETVPATDEPVPMHSTSTPQDNAAAAAAAGDVLDTEPLSPKAKVHMKNLKKLSVAVGAIIFAGGLLWQYRHKLHHRTIDPDGYVFMDLETRA